MKERPILFSAPMVRAILEGRKTQTRRVVAYKPPPRVIFPLLGRDSNPTGEWFFTDPVYERVGHSGHFCPYGQPGDRLWVRETFQPLFGPEAGLTTPNWKTGYGYQISYVATEGRRDFLDSNTDELSDRCKPAIFMPRWASRITLEVIDVRVQRLQEISEGDIIAEGCPNEYLLGRNWFTPLWDTINAKRGFGWAVNPWVWAVSFKQVKA